MVIPTASDFQAHLNRIFHDARERGVPYLDVKSGDLHRQVGGYPASNHRMPVCCAVMRKNMKVGDSVLYEPPKGNGATLQIRYLAGKGKLEKARN
jgi:5-methylcytosine-specific restriction protein A